MSYKINVISHFSYWMYLVKLVLNLIPLFENTNLNMIEIVIVLLHYLSLLPYSRMLSIKMLQIVRRILCRILK